MVAQSLIVSGGEEKKFGRALAWRLKFWLLGLPVGIGSATLRAIIKLWLGFSIDRSGVFSAGNGAATRSAIIGVCYGENITKLKSLIKISTRITHSDPKAEYGALAVAIAAHLAFSNQVISPQAYYQKLQQSLEPEASEFLELIQHACYSAAKKESAAIFAFSIGNPNGISGYVYRTVPVVIQVWLRHQQDYRGGIKEIIELGGDTDSTAAILGGIIGSAVGKSGIPQQWLDKIWEFPRTIDWMENLAKRLLLSTQGTIDSPLALPFYFLIPRNLFFLSIVIIHLFWRLLPI